MADAPARVELTGHGSEPVVHTIDFDFGSIQLSRLPDGSYWAGISVRTAWLNSPPRFKPKDRGRALSCRVHRQRGTEIVDPADLGGIEHVAVRIARVTA